MLFSPIYLWLSYLEASEAKVLYPGVLQLELYHVSKHLNFIEVIS